MKDILLSQKKNKMLVIKNIFIALTTLLIINACSSVDPLQEVDFTGFSQIEEGDSAEIKWQVLNAENVSVKGIDQSFEWKDTLIVSPKESSKYYFTFLNKKDTLEKTWRVYVKSKPELITNNSKKLDYEASYTNSDYFKGVLESGKITNPYQVKLMRVKYPIGNDKIKLNALILDEFGNHLPGLSDQFVNWSVSHICDDGVITNSIPIYKELPLTSSELDFGIMLDNSAAADYNQELLQTIKSFALDMGKKDRFLFSTFNQNNEVLIPLSRIDESKIKNLKTSKADGLNAFHKSAYSNIVSMKGGKNIKSLVVISFSSNNAATIYNPQDIIRTSRKYKVPVYIITVGDAIDSYTMKYICSASGGRFYSIEQDEVFKVIDILNEIKFSMYSSYEFEISLQKNQELSCVDNVSELKLNFNDKEFVDEIQLIENPDWLSSRHQSVAAFDYKSVEFDNKFIDLVKSLARVLEDNPSYAVELIGHSSIEGSAEKNLEISTSRAENIASELIKLGVDRSQIKVRGEGSNMPIYFMPHSPWQQYYNRRVELRWLIPEMLPYEIIADQFWTEEEAINMVNTWRERGFRSYYQRYLINNKPSYRIKLWGFETLKEAEKVVSSISSKYNVKSEIE